MEEALKQVQLARKVLEDKGAPVAGTAAGHLILALEALLDGETRRHKETFNKAFKGEEFIDTFERGHRRGPLSSF